MKNFSAAPKILNLYFLEYLNIVDSKTVFRFFISILDQKLQPFKVGPVLPFLAVFTVFSPTWKGCNFWSKIDIKNLSTDLESAMFKYFKKY